MKINKDILKALEIENIYLQSNNNLFRCIPLKIKKDCWIISTETDTLTEIVTVKIKFDGVFIKFNAVIDSFIEDSGLHSFIYVINLIYTKSELDDNQKLFFSKLSEMENKHKEWNKRKEERYDIGVDEQKGEMLNLKSLEQVVIFENIQLPCVINNLSYSGAQITTLESDFFKEKKLVLSLSFIRPIEQVQILATIKHASIKILSNNQTISILSVKFDSSPLEYKERLSNYIKQLEQKELNYVS